MKLYKTSYKYLNENMPLKKLIDICDDIYGLDPTARFELEIYYDNTEVRIVYQEEFSEKEYVEYYAVLEAEKKRAAKKTKTKEEKERATYLKLKAKFEKV